MGSRRNASPRPRSAATALPGRDSRAAAGNGRKRRPRLRRRALFLLVLASLLGGAAVIAWLAVRQPAALVALVARPRVPSRPLLNGNRSLREACSAVGIAYPPSRPRLVIDKAGRILSLFAGDVLVKEYPVGLGRRPTGDKEREGDGRTPEGEFYLCSRLERSRWCRFLGISYPAPDDARRALEAGRIGAADLQAIEAAVAPHRGTPRRQPPWNTPLGGEIGIHGGGSGLDWTLGCIAVENDAVIELFDACPLGTPVRIW